MEKYSWNIGINRTIIIHCACLYNNNFPKIAFQLRCPSSENIYIKFNFCLFHYLAKWSVGYVYVELGSTFTMLYFVHCFSRTPNTKYCRLDDFKARDVYSDCPKG